MKEYRDRVKTKWDIIFSLYEAKINEKDPLNITNIMTKANLNYKNASKLLRELHKDGAIIIVSKDEKTKTYQLSEKGEGLMNFFEKNEYILKDFRDLGVYPLDKPIPKKKEKVAA